MRQRTRPKYHAADPQSWATDQLRQRHNDALLRWGEYSMFVLLWRAVDLEAGLVSRCQTCLGADGAEGRVASAFRQSTRRECLDCLGTGLDGGYKAKIVRPALWKLSAQTDMDRDRGQVQQRTAQVESTDDFRLRVGDFIFRGDGSRWQVQNYAPSYLSTGFQTTTRERNIIGFAYGQVVEEDPASVAHIIPPLGDNLTEALDLSRVRFPVDFSEYEVLRGASLLDSGVADTRLSSWGALASYRWSDFARDE